MEIVVIGDESNLKECKAKFAEDHNYHFASNPKEAMKYFKSDAVVFDFAPKDISNYNLDGMPVFLNSVNTSLKHLLKGKDGQASFFGFCGMPSFLNREIFEITIQNEETAPVLEKVCYQLNTKFKIVDDRVGMVTPRIICMIINEAYFAIEEGVASRTDIDLAMKLGTNYPFGPFEWCEKIGIRNVYELLSSVYNDTKDERYKICELLKKEALA